jgi:spore coat protein CotF
MPFGAHETMEAHEILNEKMNMINHFSLYAQQAKNPQLRQMIDRHRQVAISAYDQLVAYTHDYNAANYRMAPYQAPSIRPEHIQYGLNNPMAMAPQMQGTMNDEQIVMGMLCFHKSSAKNHIAASLECADPNVRQMLVDGAVTCTNQAYEVFLFMNQNGVYQVPTMQDHTAKTYLHSYQPMQMPVQQ